MLLADHAVAVENKLYITGGGWSFTGPGPSTMAIALKIGVPWDQTNVSHTIVLALMTEDGQPVMVPGPAGEMELRIEGEFEVGRPPGLVQGQEIDVSSAYNLQSVPLPPGQRLRFELSIDGQSDPAWQLPFATRPAPVSTSGPTPDIW